MACALVLTGCKGEVAKHKAAGNVLLKRKDFAGAEAEYRKAVAAKPSDPGSHFYLGEALFGEKRLPEAKAEYAKAIELKPTSEDAHRRMAELLMAMAPEGDAATIDEALSHLAAVLHENSKDYVALTVSAKLELSKARSAATLADKRAALDQALAHLHTAAKVHSDDPPMLYDLAITAARRAAVVRELKPADEKWAVTSNANEAEANDTLKKLEAVAGTSYVAPYAAAMVHTALGRTGMAIAALKDALTRPDAQPTIIEADPGFAPLLRADHQFSDLMDSARPGGREALTHRSNGDALMQRRDFAGAESEYRKASVTDPKSVLALTGMGNALMWQNQFDGARDAYQKALLLEPASREANMGMADLLLESATETGAPPKLEEALGHVDAVLKETPSDAVALLYSAKLLASMAAAAPAQRGPLLDEAVSRLQRALAVNAKEVAVLFELSAAAARRAAHLRDAKSPQPDIDAADKLATDTLGRIDALNPGSGIGGYARAVVQTIGGHTDDALTTLKAAVGRPGATAETVAKDPNFAPLVKDPRFQALIAPPKQK